MMKNKKKIQKLQIEIRHINKNNKLLATAEAKRVEGNVRFVSMCFDEYDNFPPGIRACSNQPFVVQYNHQLTKGPNYGLRFRF